MKRLLALIGLFAFGCVPMPSDLPPHNFPHDCEQYVEVCGSTKDFHATLLTYEKRNGVWIKILELPATVGRNGIALPEAKKEGDWKTPRGLFPLELAFGYAENIETGLNYRQAGAKDLWVDDAESPDYNRWVTAPTKAKSFEEMKRKDDTDQRHNVRSFPLKASHVGWRFFRAGGTA